MTINYKPGNFFVFMLALLALNACKKTEQLPALAGDKITAYSVTNTNQVNLLAAINESNKTITVYLPFYFGLDVIVPKIEVSAGARLEKAALPVPVLSDTTTYKVIGADNSTSVYKLKIVIQQETPLTLSNVFAQSPNDGDAFTVAGGVVVQGNFNTLNYNLVNVFLVNSAGNEIPLIIDPLYVNAYVSETGYTMGPYIIPNALTIGSYRVRIKLNGYTTDWNTPITLIYPKLKLAYVNATVKQGETFSVSAAIFSMLDEIQSLSYTYAGNTYDLQLLSQDRKTAVIKVPDTFPAGTYPYGLGTLNITLKNGTKTTALAGLTVTAK